MRMNGCWRLLLITLSFGAALMMRPLPSALAVEDAIIAVVDDDVITAKDMQDYLRGIYAQLRIEGRTDTEIKEIMQQYEAKGVDQLVDDRLILAEANRQGMQIRPQAIEDRLTEIKKKYTSTQEFLSAINKEGVTISDIRKKIEEQFKARYIVTRAVREKIAVNPREVTDYYNDNIERYRKHTRVYLNAIAVKGGLTDEKSYAVMRAALERVRAGEDFQAVAKVYSELPDIGEVDEGNLNDQFKSVIDTMKPGDVSDIVAIPEGLYILKLAARTEGAVTAFEIVKEEIYQLLFDEKFRQKFPLWLESLRKKSYVEIKK